MSIMNKFRTGWRSRSRSQNRRLDRYANRMVTGIPRPRPPDYLAIACRCLKAVIKMDESLNPYIEDQIRLQQARIRDQEIDALLARVYGLAPPISQ